MAHELVPKSGRQFSAADVARRLSEQFAHVVIDEARGHSEALKTAEWIERANPAVFLGKHEDALAFAKRLRALPLGEAIYIQFGDDPNLTLAITVWPQQSIKFGYAGADEENQVRHLVERCAKALEAELVTI